jgi:hypothetical protein
MSPEPVSTAHLINPSDQSVSVFVSFIQLLDKGSEQCIPFTARQRLCKHIPAANNARINKRIVGSVCLCIPLLLLGKNSVRTFPHQRRIVADVVLYAVRVVLKEITRLDLPSTVFSAPETL